MASRTGAIPATDPDPDPDPNPDPDAAATGNWTVVLPRRRQRGCRGRCLRGDATVITSHRPLSHSLNPTVNPLPWTPSDTDDDPARVARILQKMRSAAAKLEASAFCRRFISRLRDDPRIRANLARASPPPEKFRIVVYGVGSIESYESPRLQLSLALILGRELGGDLTNAVEVFDPVLSAAECAAAEVLGCRVVRVDERGRRSVEQPTLFYMPHCEAALYDNLLAANWGRPSALGQMVVLGNSFREYEKYVEGGLAGRGSVAVADKARYVLVARGFVEEIGVENVGLGEGDESIFRAFNETSWHFFRSDVVKTALCQLESRKRSVEKNVGI